MSIFLLKILVLHIYQTRNTLLTHRSKNPGSRPERRCAPKSAWALGKHSRTVVERAQKGSTVRITRSCKFAKFFYFGCLLCGRACSSPVEDAAQTRRTTQRTRRRVTPKGVHLMPKGKPISYALALNAGKLCSVRGCERARVTLSRLPSQG